MVDTINPQTGQPEGNNPNNLAEANSAVPQSNNFYSGFNKPDEVRVNLANEGAPTESVDSVSAVSGNTAEPPDSPSPEPMASQVSSHQVYSVSSKEDVKKLLFASAIGLGVVILVTTITYFASASFYGRSLENEKSELVSLRSELEKEEETPAPLKVEEEVEIPESNAPTTPKEEPKEETPIITPTPTSPSSNNSGQG